jgi:glycosyltransferase involved in cell wall biosynthesis
MGTDTLRSSLDLPGLEFKGQLAQDELDSLLISAQCVLIPQFWGLGTLTRLSELACAGIPVMVSQHPTFASDMPPQIEIVGNTWNEWFSAIKNMNNRPSSTVSNFDDYRAWEKKQPQTLSDLLSRAVY